MDFNLEFCDKYGYPFEVKEQFRRILNMLKSYDVVSAVLTGSAATGQLSYELTEKDIKIFSDYDILIVVNKRCLRYIKEFKNHLVKLSSELNKNSSTFKIDFSFIDVNKLHKLPQNIYTHVLKKKGITIFGEDIKDRIIGTDFSNRNLLNLEGGYLINALWSIFLFMPVEFLNKEKFNEISMKNFNYIICNSILEIVQWILLLEGHWIIDKFEGVNFIKRANAKFGFSHFMGEKFALLLDIFMKGKLAIKFDMPTKELYKEAIECIINALRYLIHRRTLMNLDRDSDIISYVLEFSACFLNDNNIKNRTQNFISFSRNIVFLLHYNPRFLYYYMFRKSALFIAIFLDFHLTVLNHLEERKPVYYFELMRKFRINNLVSNKNKININTILEIKYSLIDLMGKIVPYPWLFCLNLA